jgi:L-arabinose isomerase
MVDFTGLEVWFVTGSQHLYGNETLTRVAEHAHEIAQYLSQSHGTLVRIVPKPVMTSAESIHKLCLQANSSETCVGLIFWMHTFSPAKMWIAGVKALNKPIVHLHTQFNRHLPWSTIDMDFMNMNQSAHGDREFGFLLTRMRVNRKIIVGFWRDPDVQTELAMWTRAACAWHDAETLKIARFGDNMRDVAVTEGGKVEAQIRLQYAVHGFGVGDLVDRIDQVSNHEVQTLASEYDEIYEVAESLRPGGQHRPSLENAARIERGLRRFLEEGGFKAFTDNFQDLHGLSQLPGIAVQRLMADGYGFGAEGDWKTAALVRSMKVMSSGLSGGTSFMEDYTYHFKDGGQVLGAHMLEICPSVASARPSVQIHPLAIGGKADPVRLVFTAPTGPAVCASLIDLGGRFRLIVNEVEVIAPEEPLPKLPVARAIWLPKPNLKVAAAAWLLAGGAHHTGFSQAVTSQHLEDFAEMAGLEFLIINDETRVREFKQELRWNEAYYGSGQRM